MLPAVLARRNGAQAFGRFGAVRPTERGGRGFVRVGRQDAAAGGQQLAFAGQHFLEQRLAGQRGHDSGEACVRNPYTRQGVADCVVLVDAPDDELPVHPELVAGEAERAGLGPADLVGLK